MKKQILIIMLLALIALVAFPVHAQTITMSNPGGIAERDIIVYFPNGTMQGFYNSTSVITLDSSTDYIFAMKPLQSNPLEDPATWLNTVAFPFLESNVIGILLAVVFIVMLRKR
jgi:hypothetical protein